MSLKLPERKTVNQTFIDRLLLSQQYYQNHLTDHQAITALFHHQKTIDKTLSNFSIKSLFVDHDDDDGLVTEQFDLNQPNILDDLLYVTTFAYYGIDDDTPSPYVIDVKSYLIHQSNFKQIWPDIQSFFDQNQLVIQIDPIKSFDYNVRSRDNIDSHDVSNYINAFCSKDLNVTDQDDEQTIRTKLKNFDMQAYITKFFDILTNKAIRQEIQMTPALTQHAQLPLLQQALKKSDLSDARAYRLFLRYMIQPDFDIKTLYN